jgi:hypothetical protein
MTSARLLTKNNRLLKTSQTIESFYLVLCSELTVYISLKEKGTLHLRGTQYIYGDSCYNIDDQSGQGYFVTSYTDLWCSDDTPIRWQYLKY